MYGSVLFHQGRFRRLTGYRRLSSTRCVAEIAGATRVGWFGAFLPQTSILGDPALRDAAMHAIQACVPHRTLLPIGLAGWSAVWRWKEQVRWSRPGNAPAMGIPSCTMCSSRIRVDPSWSAGKGWS